MKKLALVLGLVGLASCDNVNVVAPSPDQKEIESLGNTGGTFTVRLVKFQGHDYVVMDGFKQGGICHSESCECKNK